MLEVWLWNLGKTRIVCSDSSEVENTCWQAPAAPPITQPDSTKWPWTVTCTCMRCVYVFHVIFFFFLKDPGSKMDDLLPTVLDLSMQGACWLREAKKRIWKHKEAIKWGNVLKPKSCFHCEIFCLLFVLRGWWFLIWTLRKATPLANIGTLKIGHLWEFSILAGGRGRHKRATSQASFYFSPMILSRDMERHIPSSWNPEEHYPVLAFFCSAWLDHLASANDRFG